MTGRDNYEPSGAWEFDADVTSVFDDMISRSIPGYSRMRELVATLASTYLSDGDLVLDLGCSTGGTIESISSHSGAKTRFMGLEVSSEMLQEASRRFRGREDISLVHHDLRDGLPEVKCDAILSVLTIQFVPIEYRQELLLQVYRNLKPGGIFILVEKCLANSAEGQKVLTETYYDFKRSQGYSDSQIASKKSSLEGVLVPVTDRLNELWMKQAGFQIIEMFWKDMVFTGWLAQKSES